MRFIFNPPSALTIFVIFIGLSLIWWDSRQPKANSISHTPAADRPLRNTKVFVVVGIGLLVIAGAGGFFLPKVELPKLETKAVVLPSPATHQVKLAAPVDKPRPESTKLRLFFRAAGVPPEELGEQNVRWKITYFPEQKDLGCSTSGLKVPGVGESSLACFIHQFQTIYRTVLILYFDSPIEFKDISIESDTGEIPKWQQIVSNKNLAVLDFDDSPTNAVLSFAFTN